MTDDHSHCDHSPADYGSVGERLDEASRLCLRRGGKLTEQRAAVLEALLRAGGAVGAYDLIERLQSTGGKRVAPITIYRALDFLVANDLVHRIESRNAFLACPGGHGAHPQAIFLICDACGTVVEATAPDVDASLAAIAGARGFHPRARVIELSGQCAACTAGNS